MNQNKVIIIGRITKELELKNTPTGKVCLSFSVATSRRWKDANGNRKEDTEFHNVVAWGNSAENIAKYFQKGDEIFVGGYLKTRDWADRDGKKHYRTEIILEVFDFGQKSKKNQQIDNEPTPSDPETQSETSGQDDVVSPDDLPF